MGVSPFFIVALGLFSAIALALANVSVKIAGDILVARAVLSASGALIGLPFAFFVPAPDAATFAALAVAIPAHFFYQLCLVGAMSRGSMPFFPPWKRVKACLSGRCASYPS